MSGLRVRTGLVVPFRTRPRVDPPEPREPWWARPLLVLVCAAALAAMVFGR